MWKLQMKLCKEIEAVRRNMIINKHLIDQISRWTKGLLRFLNILSKFFFKLSGHSIVIIIDSRIPEYLGSFHLFGLEILSVDFLQNILVLFKLIIYYYFLYFLALCVVNNRMLIDISLNRMKCDWSSHLHV